MHYTRIYSDDQGHSNFEDIEVPLHDQGEIGFLSDIVEVKGLQFRINEPGYNWDFHNAQARQFILLMDGVIEIETSRGIKRQFKGGDILLVEDIEGKGHRTRNVEHQIRKSIFIKL